MPAPRVVYLAQLDAYQRMHDESCESPGRETGGILVGRMFDLPDGPCLVVVAASGPGANADRRAHTYAPDTAARQRELEAWRQSFAAFQVDYVGEWHKHPPGLRQPSSGDTLQVIEILSDDSYHLPDGIFTPLVTIEQETFLLHGFYYPRETMRPVAVPCECVDGDIRLLLQQLVELERQGSASPEPSPGNRWGVDSEALRAASAGLSIPLAEVLPPTEHPDEAGVIDMSSLPPAYQAPAPEPISAPPFPAPPPADLIPPAPPLPSRAEQEQRELEQFCMSHRLRPRVTRHTHDDGRPWYRITFGAPPTIDLGALQSAAQARQTPEGMVEVGPQQTETAPSIAEIRLAPAEQAPAEPPEVTVLLSDGHRLHVFVPQLFPAGWRSHFRLRHVLKALLEALTEARAPRQLSDLVEFHGRLVVRQVEVVCRSVADLCAEFNRTYRFQHPGRIGDLERPEGGA